MFIAAEGWRSSWKGQQKLTQPVEEGGRTFLIPTSRRQLATSRSR